MGKQRALAPVELIIVCFLSLLLPSCLGGTTGQIKEELENVTKETRWTW